MPNHITNILKFKGDSEQVHAMLDKIKSDELGFGSIDFNKIIPMPESLNIEAGSRTDEALYVCMMALNPAAPDMGVPKLSSEEYQKLAGIVGRSKGEQFMTLDAQRISRASKYTPLSDVIAMGQVVISNFLQYGCGDWYGWCNRNWGTKWNAYDIHFDQESQSIHFLTAWDTPMPVIDKLSQMFPEVEIDLQWADEDVLLANPMKSVLDKIDMGTMKEWNFTAEDGTEIKGMICLPPAFDPNRKYPLIVYYYGGTTPTTRGITSPYCAQLFASRDYVVYVIQPSGAIGYGQEFSARHVNAWGERTADEIIEGTKKFCAAHPFVNDKRIGCIGASYGGFMTMYLQTKTDLFAAAVSHAGISNVTSYWGEGYWGYSYNSVAAAGSYPWNNPDLFTKHGALFNADKIKTPLLLLHGTVDTNVPIGESIQLYNALKILGKPVEFITVDGENHFISDYPKRELWHNSIMAWFARWLQDSPAWWNDLYPERHW